jgi:hypothetical protein
VRDCIEDVGVVTDRNARGGVAFLPTAPTITLASRHAGGGGGNMIRLVSPGAPASGVSPWSAAANDLLAFSFTLTAPITNVNKVFWINGSAAGGNTSIGIYDADYVLLAQTASTAGSGNSLPQVVSLPLRLGPGLYYCAIAHNATTTNQFQRWSLATTGTAFWKMMGCWRQASVTVGALPATATPTAITNIAFPVFGTINRTGYDV